LRKIRLSKLKGEPLKESLVRVAKERFDELSKQMQTMTKYF